MTADEWPDNDPTVHPFGDAPSPSEQDRDDQATPHREAGEQFRTRTVTA